MLTEVRPAERPQKLTQSFIAEEVHALVGDFELCIGLAVTLFALALLRLFGVKEVLLLHFGNDLVDQLFDLRLVEFVELFLGFVVEELAGLKRLADGLAQVLHSLLAVELLEARHWILKARVQEKVRQRLHQVFKTDGGGKVTVEFGVACALHGSTPASILVALAKHACVARL